MKNSSENFPDLGFGLGLRPPHYPYIFEHVPKVDWFEIISENFMDTDGRPRRNLARICEQYPVVMHGVAMSIGTVDPLNSEYMTKLKTLIKLVKPAWVSDHLCWTGIAHKNSHDLLPVPYTEEALKHIISKIKQVQDYLERPIVLENPSTYLEFKTSHIPEAEFIKNMVEESGCHLLLDVNNVYVSCYNHRLDPKSYIDTLPLDKVAQIHLSGHSNMGTYIIDTHDNYVVDEVWALYKYVISKAGRVVNTMVEWDDKIPEFPILYAELDKAKAAAKDAKNYAPLPDLASEQVSYVANIITPLASAQQAMQDAILQGADNNSDDWIRSKAEFAAKDQLAVYINAYRYRLYDVVAEDYPVLQYYLGNDIFEKLLWDFVNTAHSEHFNIGRYAVKLPDFIKQTRAGDEFVYELAVLENAVSQLSDPPETVPLEPKHLEGITPDILMETILQPRKALEIFQFSYPVNVYYCEVKEDKTPSPPQAKNSFLAVFRHEDVVWRMDLGENEYHLLKKIFAATPIGQALDQVQSELNLPEEELITNLSNWFSRWMRNGLLAH